MKGKTTVKGTGKDLTAMAQANRSNPQDTGGYAPAVPISVYRELAKELENAKQQLSVVKAQNMGLKQQNQALRQEVIRVIQSAATLKDILQASKPAKVVSPPANAHPPAAASQFASASPQSPSNSSPHTVAEELIAELDRTLEADIGSSFQSVPSPRSSGHVPGHIPEGVVGGPFCEVTPVGLNERAPDIAPEPLFTEQPISPPNAIALEEEEKSSVLGGIWLPLTLIVVIVTAFSAGFLIVLPFIEADKNN